MEALISNDDRRVLDRLYAINSLSDKGCAEKIPFLRNKLGYTAYFAYGGNETPEMELESLELDYLAEM